MKLFRNKLKVIFSELQNKLLKKPKALYKKTDLKYMLNPGLCYLHLVVLNFNILSYQNCLKFIAPKILNETNNRKKA